MNHYLVADIGGTNARLGLVTAEGNEVFGIEQVSNKDYPQLVDVVKNYLKKAQCVIKPTRACFAVASPVTSDRVSFTNNAWSFSINELKSQLGFEYLKVINDFEAVALSLPFLGEKESRKIGRGTMLRNQPMAVLGPGTGLGMAALIPASPRPIPLATEGGHAGFAAGNDLEHAISSFLRQRLGFVSIEDLLSGQGLANIYEALCAIRGRPFEALDARSISERALAASDPLCVESLQCFCAALGSAAGDIALKMGARGGVYIAGGIVPRIVGFLETSAFRERFEAKGRYRSYMEAIPTLVITATQPGLIGAAAIFDEETG